MDWKIFIEALSNAEYEALSDALYRKKLIIAKLVPVLAYEVEIAEQDRIRAIKAYKDRTGLGLLESKTAIDLVVGVKR